MPHPMSAQTVIELPNQRHPRVVAKGFRLQSRYEVLVGIQIQVV
jgi:hypothetical protein